MSWITRSKGRRLSILALESSNTSTCYACPGPVSLCRSPKAAFSSNPARAGSSGSDWTNKEPSNVYTRYEKLFDKTSRKRSSNWKDDPPELSRSAKSLQEIRPPWVAHRAAMKERFPDGWNPPRKVSRSDMALIRRLHGIDKEHWSTPNLAERFKISPEAIRRILASSWRSQEDMKEEEIIHDLGNQSRADEAPTRNDVQGHSTLQQYHSSPRHYFDHLVSESSSLNQTVAQLKEATPLRDGFKISRNSKTFKWDQHI